MTSGHPDAADHPAASGAVVTLHGLHKHYAATQALAGVDLELRAGEVYGLVGANGAGKSTLIRILAGAVVPDAGEVRVAGVPLRLGSPLVALQAGIATVHQQIDAGILPGHSVAENLALDLPRQPLDRPAVPSAGGDGAGAGHRGPRRPRSAARRARRPAGLQRSPADRARASPRERASGPRPRRAHLGAVRSRDPAPVRDDPAHDRARRGRALRLAPAAGGRGSRGARRRAARRPPCARVQRDDLRPRDRRGDPRHGAPAGVRGHDRRAARAHASDDPSPGIERPGPRDPRRPAAGPRPARRADPNRPAAAGPRRGRGRDRRAVRARGGRQDVDSSRRCSASGRSTAATRCSADARSPPGPRARPSTAASTSFPRTGPRRPCCPSGRSRPT